MPQNPYLDRVVAQRKEKAKRLISEFAQAMYSIRTETDGMYQHTLKGQMINWLRHSRGQKI